MNGFRLYIFIFGMLLCGNILADIEPSMRVPRELEGTQIVDKLGTKVDLSLVFTRHDGVEVALKEYFDKSGDEAKPVIVTMGYYECPMLCSLVINGMVEALEKVDLKMGEDYKILSFTVDPREKPEMAKAKRERYLKIFSKEKGWDFFMADGENEEKLAESLGFGYKFHEPTGQYAHGAGIFILTEKGVLSRTLWGFGFEPQTVKMALVEAGAGKVGTVVDRILLSCFHYVPDSDKYGIYVFGVMRLGATLTVIVLGSMLGVNWLRERRRRTGVLGIEK